MMQIIAYVKGMNIAHKQWQSSRGYPTNRHTIIISHRSTQTEQT